MAPGPVIQHEGPVMQLSGKGLLVPGSWKRRYCVLDGRRLYYYQLNEVNIFSHKSIKRLEAAGALHCCNTSWIVYNEIEKKEKNKFRATMRWAPVVYFSTSGFYFSLSGLPWWVFFFFLFKKKLLSCCAQFLCENGKLYRNHRLPYLSVNSGNETTANRMCVVILSFWG